MNILPNPEKLWGPGLFVCLFLFSIILFVMNCRPFAKKNEGNLYCGECIRIKQKFPDTLKNPPFSSLLFIHRFPVYCLTTNARKTQCYSARPSALFASTCVIKT